MQALPPTRFIRELRSAQYGVVELHELLENAAANDATRNDVSRDSSDVAVALQRRECHRNSEVSRLPQCSAAGGHPSNRVVLKRSVRPFKSGGAENPLAEARAMMSLPRHDHVVRCLGYQEKQCGSVTLVLEFMSDGELFDLVPVLEAMPLADRCAVVRAVFYQMASGLAHLHASGLTHHDISLENFFFDAARGAVKLGDLGMAERHSTSCRRFAGKTQYMCPSKMARRSFDSRSSDVWSLGVSLFILLFGIPPFESAVEGDARFRYIMGGKMRQLLRRWGKRVAEGSEAAVDLLQSMICGVNSRLDIDQVLQHPWVAGVATLPSSSTVSTLEAKVGKFVAVSAAHARAASNCESGGKMEDVVKVDDDDDDDDADEDEEVAKDGQDRTGADDDSRSAGAADNGDISSSSRVQNHDRNQDDLMDSENVGSVLNELTVSPETERSRCMVSRIHRETSKETSLAHVDHVS